MRFVPAAIALAFLASCAPPHATPGRDSPNLPTDDGGANGNGDGGLNTPKAPKSCTGGPGADHTCGGDPNDATKPGSQDCCEYKSVPGGTFNRFNDASYPATISPFTLDTFLVTVGRFRAWVEATNGDLRSSAPPAGGGAHPKIPNSGWRPEWSQFLPSSRAEVDRMLGPEETEDGFMACQYGTNLDDFGALTWWTPALDKKVLARNSGKFDILAENTKEQLDRKPLNCVPWYVLFAFCVWDGGRLPTDAEFSFAAQGGEEQRPFPWGTVAQGDLARIGAKDNLSEVPVFDVGGQFAVARLYDSTLGANVFEDHYSFTYGGKTMAKTDNATHIAPVGRKPKGNGKWGHADLAGGIFEWMLDEGPIRPGPCNDCANVSYPANDATDPNADTSNPDYQNPGGRNWYLGGARAIRGSAWDNAILFANSQTSSEIPYYTSYPVQRTYRALGGRCAR